MNKKVLITGGAGFVVFHLATKLSREGVYKAQPRQTKSGEPIIRKAELVAQIQETLGVEFPSLVKASKADLQKLVDIIS